MVAASHTSPQRVAPPSCISSVWGSGHIHASERPSSPHTPLEKGDLHARITSERGASSSKHTTSMRKVSFRPHTSPQRVGPRVTCHKREWGLALQCHLIEGCLDLKNHLREGGLHPHTTPQRGSSSLRMISERVFHPHKSPQTRSSHLTHLLRHRVLAVTCHLREGGLVLMRHLDSFLSITSGRRGHVHQHHSESGFLALTRHLREGGLLSEHHLRESGSSLSCISSERGASPSHKCDLIWKRLFAEVN